MRKIHIKNFRFVLCLFLTGFCAGCSKAGNSATNTNSAPDAADVAAVSKPESVAAQEAATMAIKCAEDHWVMKEDGTLWTGYATQPYFYSSCNVQFKPVTPHLEEKELTEADKLNGIEWQGVANFSAPAFRFQMMDKSWRDWQPWTLGTFWSEKLEKRNGTWSAVEQSIQLGSSTSQDGEMTFGFYSIKSTKPTADQPAP